jgi:uncharacterized delta-60 repeat protein
VDAKLSSIRLPLAAGASACCLCLTLVPTSAGTPGADLASSRPGIVTTAIGVQSEIDAVALQRDGKIVAAGWAAIRVPPYDGIAVARYIPDGALDRSFGGDGKVTTFFRPFMAFASDLALQRDGKVVVVGRTDEAGELRSDFAVVRYKANGALDRSFAGDGKLRTVVGEFARGAEAVVLQPDGKIVVAGNSEVDALVRYAPDGTLDTSFGGDGMVIGQAGIPADDLALQSDGKLVITGVQFGDALSLARYLPNGSLDPTFGGDGKVTTPIDGVSDSRLAIQPDGKIIALAFDYLGEEIALVRFDADGSPDPSFDGDGKVITASSATESVYNAALQGDGKIVVAGDGFELARYNQDGSLDSSFGAAGKVTTTGIGEHAHANAVALQPDGRIVVAGATFPAASFTVARYTPDGSLDARLRSGVRECVVPSVVGLFLVRAKARIAAARCRTGRVSGRPSTRHRGRVIYQYPDAGRHLSLRGVVELTVSLGMR